MRKTLLATLVLGTTLLISGCASGTDGLSQQFRNGDNKNYIQGDGTISEWAKSSRQAPVVWKGVPENGGVLGSANLTGVVTVLNFWYAGCAPAARKPRTWWH